MNSKIEKFIEKYACVFVLYSMLYLVALLVWEIIKWVIITLK